mmetsp:Transcript_32688/g.70599  ORF Transcript_32688/g.70599 Transcript_32688/m.70599 type:complete len:236 (+) Transcript_32688:1340-2047(+)
MVPLVGLGLQIFHGLRCPFALVEKASDRLRRCLWRCLYLVVRDGEQPVQNVGRGPNGRSFESLRCFRPPAGGHWQNVDVLGQNERGELHYAYLVYLRGLRGVHAQHPHHRDLTTAGAGWGRHRNPAGTHQAMPGGCAKRAGVGAGGCGGHQATHHGGPWILRVCEPDGGKGALLGSHQIPGGRPGESQQHWQRLRVGGRAAVLVGGVGEVHGDAAGEAEVRVPAAMSQPQGGSTL